jgi:hypothetical protein
VGRMVTRQMRRGTLGAHERTQQSQCP